MTAFKVRWCFNFMQWNPSKEEILKASCGIQSEEKERLDKFVFKEDFKSSLIGRLMMRKFVNEALNVPYNEIIFIRDDKGKPVLKLPNGNYPQISFNVSHHGSYTVLAGDVESGTLGVDVMKLEYSGGKSLSEFFRIMTRHFADSEWHTIKSCSSEKAQIAMFCRHWSLKESYVKAVGVGITINLQDIRFKINTPCLSKDNVINDTELFVKNAKQGWQFQETLLDDEHCVSVAINNKTDNNDGILFKQLQFNDLLNNFVPLHEEDEGYSNKFFSKLTKK